MLIGPWRAKPAVIEQIHAGPKGIPLFGPDLNLPHFVSPMPVMVRKRERDLRGAVTLPNGNEDIKGPRGHVWRKAVNRLDRFDSGLIGRTGREDAHVELFVHKYRGDTAFCVF